MRHEPTYRTFNLPPKVFPLIVLLISLIFLELRWFAYVKQKMAKMRSGEKAGESSITMKMWIWLGVTGAGSQPARSSSARSGYVLLMYDDS
jgi:hypothetical protein